jgi:hypothetical protein
MRQRLIVSLGGLAALLAAAAPQRAAAQTIDDSKPQVVSDAKPPDPLLLLLEKNVQDDLRLSAGQKARLKASEEKTQAQVEKVIDDVARTGDAKKAQREIDRINEEANKVLLKVKEELSAEQRKRWKQIEIQFAELRAFEMPDVRKELGLSDEQTAKILAVQKGLQENVKRIVGSADGTRDVVKPLASARKEAMRQAFATLDDQQKKKWEKMTGPLLELSTGPKFARP